MRILVVDDEPALRSSLERALGLDRHEVELAEDGEEGLRLARDAPPDLIVLDVGCRAGRPRRRCRRPRAGGDARRC